LRRYSTPADYFNLVFILLIAIVGLISWLTVDLSFGQLRAFAQGLVTLNPPAAVDGLVYAEVVLLSLFLLYMPFTHMTHFVGKYFTYHAVRWDDTPNFGGVSYERQLQRLLTRKVSWSAPHVGKGRSWVEVATKGVQE
jgi:nitrate reductase gamma subunit